MPFTVFHLAAGLLPKGLLKDRFSLASFTVANLLLDFEPGVKMLFGIPGGLHEFHTWATAAVVVLISYLAGIVWLGRDSDTGRVPDRAVTASVLGAVVGAVSHLLIDAAYHADVAANLHLFQSLPRYEFALLTEALCLTAGAIGAAIMVVRLFNGVSWRELLD